MKRNKVTIYYKKNSNNNNKIIIISQLGKDHVNRSSKGLEHSWFPILLVMRLFFYNLHIGPLYVNIVVLFNKKCQQNN